MSKHLIVLGHGKGPGGVYDPGATGCGTSEDKFLNKEFLPVLKKYAPSNVAFYTTKNMFAYRDANKVAGYDSVTELHLDWANGASGGHVIIYKGYNPDNVDKSIRDAIKRYVGLRMSGGISRRNNLYNLNVFAKRGITYRLIELGFINNAKDMSAIRRNIENYAIDILSAITGKKIEKKEKGYLSLGDVNDDVKELQRYLRKLGYNLAVDGSYGEITERTVKSFQKQYGLKVDGYFGPSSRKKLEEVLSENKEEKQMEKNLKETGFKDVPDNEYYSKAIKWAKDKKITKGIGNDEFGLGDELTREDFITMLHRYHKEFGE
ncbi:peptidoglycan-binding protein [Halobacillus karajensis]|uniref:Spore cortex-lytic enzyme n=1 Tax=Halobacillus karajensis TaxID=195088 RepID=A0A059NW66_9BACI|nr:peptidoglycan-binding protein [Halobacillus karajensis]CDQ22560.1 spore cortex-lytic enzyme [Halobacillus karajensis]CDQ26042.1 spore cortex-lytic enzyme [Halobacillus karajensis]